MKLQDSIEITQVFTVEEIRNIEDNSDLFLSYFNDILESLGSLKDKDRDSFKLFTTVNAYSDS